MNEQKLPGVDEHEGRSDHTPAHRLERAADALADATRGLDVARSELALSRGAPGDLSTTARNLAQDTDYLRRRVVLALREATGGRT